MASFLSKDHRVIVDNQLSEVNGKLQELSLDNGGLKNDWDQDTAVEEALLEVKSIQNHNICLSEKLLLILQEKFPHQKSHDHDYFKINIELVKVKLLVGPIKEAQELLSDLESRVNTDDFLGLQYQVLLLKGEVDIALGKLKDAERCFKEAVTIAKRENFDVDTKAEAQICLQSCIYAQGKNDEALTSLTPLLAESDLSPRIVALLKRTLGNIYRSAANWHLAKKYLSEAVDIAKSIGDTIHESEWTGELGRVYRSAGLHQEALKRQKEAFKAALKRGDVARLAAASGYIGFTMYSLPTPNCTEAIKYLGTRLLLAEQRLGDRVGVRWCLNNIGKVYLSMGIVEPAIQCFQRSLEEAKEMGSLLGEGTALGNLGSALREAGKHHEAVECHVKYLENAKQRLDTGGEAIMLYELAVDYLLIGDLKKATEYAVKGVTTLNDIRFRLKQDDDQLKIGNFEKNQSKLYNILQQLLTEQGRYDAALLISELGRAQALSDLMQARLNTKSNLNTAMTRVFESEASINQTAVTDAHSQIHTIANELKSTIVVYSIISELGRDNVKTMYVYSWVISPGKEKAMDFSKTHIGVGEVAVGLSLDEDYLSSLRRDIGVRGIKLVSKSKKPTKPVDEKSMTNVSADNDTTTMKSKDEESVKQQSSESQDKLQALYQCLIAPLLEHLPKPSHDKAPRLIIVPHDAIFNVPFPALKSGREYLIEQFTLSQAPSLSILNLLLEKGKSLIRDTQSAPPTLVVGNPTMPHGDIPQLPGADKEAQIVHDIMGGTVLTKEAATKQAVFCNLLTHSIIHMATHATIYDSLAAHLETEDNHEQDSSVTVGDYSIKGAIVLAKSSSTCSGILTSQELQTASIPCELMTLSCCRTACGKVTGDGILGLSRAVLVAGAQCFIVTLWPIEDKSTTVLMEAFYTHYKISKDAPSAMRAAILKLLGQGLGVAYWGAFVVSGVSPGMLKE